MAKNISFHDRVRKIIKKIPPGKVATYGQIAAIAGSPRASRQVVRVLNLCWETDRLPWFRVINSQGRISLKPGYGYEEQKQLLKKEGIKFDKNDTIDLNRFLWSPAGKAE